MYRLKIIFVLFLLVFTACRDTEIKPAEIAAEDMCAHCKMAISEKEFAAEFINQDSEAFKFDDIGCMLDYLKAKPDTKIAAYFLVDYETKKMGQKRRSKFCEIR